MRYVFMILCLLCTSANATEAQYKEAMTAAKADHDKRIKECKKDVKCKKGADKLYADMQAHAKTYKAAK
jgi:hypothetical protein